MANRSDSYSIPPAVRRVATTFRIVGWVSFWTQLVLAVISGLVLIFAAGSLGATAGRVNAASGVNPGTGAGLSLAVLGLLGLLAGVFWAFRYTRLSIKLKTTGAEARPKRGEALQILRLGLLINLIGMLLAILGAQAIVGSLVAKSASSIGNIFAGGLQSLITPLDLFLVQANTNTIMAHFIGLVATLWILRSVNRQ